VSAFHPSDCLLAVTKYDTVTLYDLTRCLPVGHLIPHTRTITGARFSSDGRVLITSAMDGRLVTHDLLSSKAIYEIALPAHASGLSVSDDGSIVGAALANGDVLLFDSRAERTATTIEAHNGYASAVEFSPSAFRPAAFFLATAGSDRTVNLFDIRATRQSYAKFHRHLETPLAVAFDDRGDVWSGTRGGELQAWRWADGNCVFRDYRPGAPLYSVAFARARQSILTTTAPPCFCEHRLDAMSLAPVRADPVELARLGN
jgi:WD40 repeat protein